MSRHIVFGGSAGIGFAYAEIHARRGARLVLIARQADGLEEARSRLLTEGASAVECISADLTAPDERQRALQQIVSDAEPVASLLVNGPSPPAGTANEVTSERLRQAEQACLAFPADVVAQLGRLTLEAGCRLLFITSSSVDQDLRPDHPFFLSGVFRRALTFLIESWREQPSLSGVQVSEWRPSVVLTPLSIRYAKKFVRPGDPFDPQRVLEQHFRMASVPTASDYVRGELDSSGWEVPK